MTIEFSCPNCQKTLRTGDEKAGKTAKCPGCGNPITVPGSSAGSAGDEQDDYEDYSESETGDDYGADEFSAGGFPPLAGGSGTKSCPMCGEQIKAAAVVCRYCGEELGGGRSGRAVSGGGRHDDYAGFWLRFVAYIIDVFILVAAQLIIVIPLAIMMGIGMARGGQNAEAAMVGFQLIINLVSVVIMWLYYALMESSRHQATLGKQALGIIVTNSRGGRISFGRATGRHFGKIVSGIICAAGYIMAGFTERKQALHDIMADCLVVRR